MIIINGQEFTEEEFEELQKQSYQKYIKFREDIQKEFDCTCAVIVENRLGYGMICSITKEVIPNSAFCKNCASYGKVGYEIVSEE